MNLSSMNQLAIMGTLFFQKQPIINGAAFQQVPKIAVGSFVGGDDAAGGLFSWQNLENAPILILRAGISVQTASTAACTASLGTASSVASSANLMTGYSLATAQTGTNLSAPGASGTEDQLVAANSYVTLSTASGASAGAAGQVFIEYIILA